jgi:hypothetical protein
MPANGFEDSEIRSIIAYLRSLAPPKRITVAGDAVKGEEDLLRRPGLLHFLKNLADSGLTELTRVPHALDPEKGFRVRSQFTFRGFIEVAQPASPLRWIADAVLALVGAGKVITNDARQFLDRLLEVNSTRVQSDVLNRIQESRGRLEVEIRKLLHEIGRIAEQALDRARKVKEEGGPTVQAALDRLDRLEQQIAGPL